MANKFLVGLIVLLLVGCQATNEKTSYPLDINNPMDREVINQFKEMRLGIMSNENYTAIEIPCNETEKNPFAFCYKYVEKN